MRTKALTDIIRSLRACHRRGDYGYLSNILDEAQAQATFLEAALDTRTELENLEVEVKRCKKELKELQQDTEEMRYEARRLQHTIAQRNERLVELRVLAEERGL